MVNTILVVDDDAMNREVMEAFLEIEGYEVILASNGAQGLNKFRENPPDLIILDVRLPDMLGYDVCKQIKATHPHIPIMIVTGFEADDERENGIAAGADAFLSRPFGGDILIEYVNKLLQAT